MAKKKDDVQEEVVVETNQIAFGDDMPEMPEIPPIVNTNEPHMACLFLVDTSGSMGQQLLDRETNRKVIPIQELNDALNRFKSDVCKDEKTKSILDVAIVEFNKITNVVQEFTPVEYMEPVELEARGGTRICPALEKAIEMVDERSRFYRRMGTEPYKPWIVLISDGEPFDPVDDIAEKIDELTESGKLALWALSIPGAKNEVLHKLAGRRVLNLSGYDFAGFFNWVNKSMRAVSQSAPGEKVKAEALPESVTIDDLM